MEIYKENTIHFIKIKHERLAQGREVFTLEQYLANKQILEDSNAILHITHCKPYMQVLFSDTKERYREDNLFEVLS